MNGWKREKISNLCSMIVDCVNRTAPIVDTATPFRMIRTTNVRDGRINLSEARFVDESTFVRWTRRAEVLDGDVILTREAPIGEVGLIRGHGKVFLGQRLMQYRADLEKLDPQFLYYSFMAPDLQHQFRTHEGSGSVVSHIRVADCHNFLLSYPPLPEQRAIAATLGALDDKIELNRKMNETLEAMARALFRDWFVDFGPTRAKMAGQAPYLSPALWDLFPERLDDEGKPEGWEFGKLGDISKTANEIVSPSHVHDDTPYIGLEHMPRRSIALSEWEGAGRVSSNKSLFKSGDFLFGKLRPYFHKVGVTPIAGICSTDIVVIEPKTPEWSGYVLACISGDDFVAYTDKTATGTKMPRTSWPVMAKYQVVLPPKELALAYNDIVAGFVRRILANIQETRTLAQTRDLLLPRLMSGELRVAEVEAALEAPA